VIKPRLSDLTQDKAVRVVDEASVGDDSWYNKDVMIRDFTQRIYPKEKK